MSRIRSEGMKPERVVRSLAHGLGYRFRLHRRDLPGKPDLVFPGRRAVIFVHGCFWHWHPDSSCPIAELPKSNIGYWKPKLERTRRRDVEHVTALKVDGWRVLTLWECGLRNLEEAAFRIREFLDPEI